MVCFWVAISLQDVTQKTRDSGIVQNATDSDQPGAEGNHRSGMRGHHSVTRRRIPAPDQYTARVYQTDAPFVSGLQIYLRDNWLSSVAHKSAQIIPLRAGPMMDGRIYVALLFMRCLRVSYCLDEALL